MPTQQFISYIMMRTIFNKRMLKLALY